MTQETCDLCGGDRLEPLYRPPTGARGLTVHVCADCALVQSLPRVDTAPRRPMAVSAGADWGNVRYGKGFRTAAALDTLAAHRSLADVRHCLDVGANRGSFVLRLRELAPAAEVLAVEPDARVIDDYRDREGIEVRGARIEDVALPAARFDLVYCSHTLEHLRSPLETLRRIRAAMTEDGLLYLEVPVLDFIGRADVVEEWFIDKHLYHYSAATLMATVRAAGLRPSPDSPLVDDENIVVVARPGATVAPPRDGARGAAARARELVRGYAATVAANHHALQVGARHIAALADGRRVVVWGAGRIFDSLVRQGGLDPACLAGLVDRHLSGLVRENHGVAVTHPDAIGELAPELVVIASRAYESEIRAELDRAVPGCDSVGLDALLGLSEQDGDDHRAAG